MGLPLHTRSSWRKRDLITAQFAEIEARVTAAKDMVALEVAMGTFLQAHGVSFDDAIHGDLWKGSTQPCARTAGSETQAEFKSQIHPVVRGLKRWHATHCLAVCRCCDVLERGPDAKRVVAIQKIADISQTIAAPSAARRTGVAVGCHESIRRHGFRVVQVGGTGAY